MGSQLTDLGFLLTDNPEQIATSLQIIIITNSFNFSSCYSDFNDLIH